MSTRNETKHIYLCILYVTTEYSRMDPTTVRVPEDDLDKIEERADEKGISKGEFIRQAIRHELNSPRLPEHVNMLEERVEELEQRVRELEEPTTSQEFINNVIERTIPNALKKKDDSEEGFYTRSQ